jgi:hypothetical protein
MSGQRNSTYLNQLAQRAMQRQDAQGNAAPPPGARGPPTAINTTAATSSAAGAGPQTGNFMALFQNGPDQQGNSRLDAELKPLLLEMLEYSNKAGRGSMAYTLMAQFIKDGQGHWAASAAATEADNFLENRDIYLVVVVATVVAAWSRDSTKATVSSLLI